MIIVHILRMITLKHGGLVGLHLQIIEEISVWSGVYLKPSPWQGGNFCPLLWSISASSSKATRMASLASHEILLTAI